MLDRYFVKVSQWEELLDCSTNCAEFQNHWQRYTIVMLMMAELFVMCLGSGQAAECSCSNRPG